MMVKVAIVAVQGLLELFLHAKLLRRICCEPRPTLLVGPPLMCAKDRMSYVVDWWQGSATAIPHTRRTCDMSFQARLSLSSLSH
jgi:hypothetical protein